MRLTRLTSVVPVVLLAAGLPPDAGAQTGAGFVDITEAAGIDFVHDAGETGEYHLPEITGSGLGFFDYDGDGDLDLYAIQAGSSAASMTGDGSKTSPNRLFEQTGPGRFVDRTEQSGLGDTGYGMGLAVGDIDNDGDLDVYLTNYGADRLYLNEGGRFRDVSASSGLTDADTPFWSASATFCDIDADGLLDLYVTHYVRYDPDKRCTQSDGSADYCSPQVFEGVSDRLYRNAGAGRFTDVSNDAGIDEASAPGLGVVCLDLNGDHRLDFYVANDGEANQLWLNQGEGRFVDDALIAGAALNDMGQPEAGMGIAVGDLDGNGDFDLFMTHIENETNTLYMNRGSDFEDTTTRAGLAATSLTRTGFGTAFLDFDHDGDLDLVIANGRVQRRPGSPSSAAGDDWKDYAEADQLLRNESDERGFRFEDPGAVAGDFVRRTEIGRGLAVADFDEDGDLDVAVSNTDAPLRLYRNDTDKRGDWLHVMVRDEQYHRMAHAARVSVVASERRWHRLALPGYGFLASHDPGAHFGLPSGTAISSIEVIWPDGEREVFALEERNRRLTLVRGTGRKAP